MRSGRAALEGWEAVVACLGRKRETDGDDGEMLRGRRRRRVDGDGARWKEERGWLIDNEEVVRWSILQKRSLGTSVGATTCSEGAPD